MTKRVQYLDILKAIAIFLVVFCHFVLLSETVAANIFMSACWMAVPTFFMVNGALLFARPLNLKKHVKKTVSVYLVLVVWKLLYMLLIPVFTKTPMAEVSMGDVLNYLFLFGELPGIINGHLWFIEALLAVYAVFPLFRIAWDWENTKAVSANGNGIDCKTADVPADYVCRHPLTWMLAIAALVCTNGFYSLEVLGDMLRTAGLWFPFSFDSLTAFQPFGKYGNMLGFFLLGALLSSCKKPLSGSKTGQRILGGSVLIVSLAALWGVKCFLSGRPEWDGILLQEGYRHVPVIFMAVGLFLLCKDVTIKAKWLWVPIQALASRTLGIFYIHWLCGWLLVNPLAAFLVKNGISFGIGANILKNIVLMIPAFVLTLLLERIPLANRLVKG